jgi:SAM-dependent methyltransferase
MAATTCDLCAAACLTLAYTPDSPRGLKVYVCEACGLTQSLPRRDRAKRRSATVSSGADWGNLRYGKGFRTAAHMTHLARHVDLTHLGAVLDVGANRGTFVRALSEAAPSARITAVEPDERFVSSYEGLSNVDLVPLRTEKTQLASAAYDLVYSSHTLEHLAHPFAALSDHARVLKPGGLLFLEVPNMALIGDSDIVEEWFIDKHLYHFTRGTLLAMLARARFEVIDAPDPADRVNLTIVARRALNAPAPVDAGNAAEAFALVAAYGAARRRNVGRLAAAARSIEAFGAGRVAIWGAGRLFHSLVVHGKLNAGALAAIVDRHLPPEAMTVAGAEIARPDALTGAKPDIIVVMSRSFADEIAGEAHALAPTARLVPFADLLEGRGFERAA